MFGKILYIGAGLDLSPIKILQDTKQFVFVDSRPRNEYGYEYYYRPFLRSNFVNNLIDTVQEKYNMKLISKEVLTNKYEEINVDDLDSTLLHFSDKERVVRSAVSLRYYISTGIPNDLYENKSLIDDIEDCDTVYVSGHDPNSMFITYMSKKFHFIGGSNTWFAENLKHYMKNDDNNCRNFCYYLLTNADKVLSYSLVDELTKELFTYNTYGEFYKKLQEVQSKNRLTLLKSLIY